MNRLAYNLAVAGCVLLLAALPSVAGKNKGTAETGRITLGDFRTKGVTSDGKAQWQLRGGNAVTEGVMVRLGNAELTFITQEKDTVVITSPRCEFNRLSKTGSSDAPLKVVHRQVTIEGVGYDVLAEQQAVHIRSNVKMTIHPEKGRIEGLLAPRKDAGTAVKKDENAGAPPPDADTQKKDTTK